MNVKLITHSSHTYGLGHLSRSRVIAEQFIDNDYDVEILELDLILDLIEALDKSFNEPTLFVIDLDPRFWKTESQSFKKYIEDIGPLVDWYIFIFDNPRFMIRKLIARRFEHVFYINPYQDRALQDGPDALSGLRYFPFTRYLFDIRKLNLEYFSFSQIAITCGGSDPHGLTYTYLDMLNSFSDEALKVSIFIGPLFDQDNLGTLRQVANTSMHQIDFVTQEDYLEKLFENSSLVLTTGGLTRYELAFCGIPFVTLNFDPVQNATSQMFEMSGASVHLGQNNQRPSRLRRTFHNSLRKILEREEIRIEMGRCGRNLFNESSSNFATQMLNLIDHAR